MMRSLYISKTGLDAQQTNLDVITNNLANTSTTGFKSVIPLFQDLIYQTLNEPGSYSQLNDQVAIGLQLGAGSKVYGTERQMSQGSLLGTQNPLDVAIQGNGFFQIIMPDGTLAYTRDGSFTKNAQGQIVTAQGYLLSGGATGGSSGAGITLPANTTSITISQSGTVQYTTQDVKTLQTAGTIPLVNFINPAGMLYIGGNLAVETPASGTAIMDVAGTNGMGSLLQYNLEQSNVNVANELVALIAAQRAYEVNARAITASDQMLNKLVSL